MHLEERHHAPASLIEFIKQYAMIVLSILTALALERGAVALQDRADARASRVRIIRELDHNAAELAHTEELNIDNLHAVDKALSALVDRMKAGTIDSTQTVAVVTQLVPHLNIALPSLERDAWESAIASHSADHLDAEDLRRFTEIYANQRDIVAASTVFLGGNWMSEISNLMLAMRLGKVEPQMLAFQLQRFMTASGQVIAMQKSFQTQVQDGGSAAPPAKK